MGVRWGVALSGVERLDAALRRTAVEVHNFRTPLRRTVDEVARPSIARNFEIGGRPDPWQELSDETIARKGSDRILVDTGQGMRSATARARWTITREQAAYVGSSFPERSWFMELHQRADDFDVAFPARPFAVVQPEDLDAMRGVFASWLDRDVIPRYTLG